ncbi:MAG: hypothetical protein AB1633_11815 [Elusimicrobiota bacterium]
MGEEPSEGVEGRFTIYGPIDNSNTIQYRIKLTDEDILMLHSQINKLGVDFNSIFKRDWRHFHIALYKEIINNDDEDDSWKLEHEGTACEKEDDSWDVYYVVGHLHKYMGTHGEHFIFNVPNDEINSLEDIKERFKKWVDEQKEKIAKKQQINRIRFFNS